MVGSIGGAGQQSIPGAVAFKPGETSQPRPADTLKQNGSGAPINAATQTQTSASKTEEVSSKVELSRNNTRATPSDPFASSNARGTQLDIRV
jgi:hypothetical protein